MRRVHADHLRRAIRLKDGSVLLARVTAVVGGITSNDVRIKVVEEAPLRDRRWLHLGDIEAIE